MRRKFYILLFSSIVFLSLFLPLVIGIYFLLPGRFRNLWMLMASLVFYAWGEKLLVVVMLAVILANYVAGILIEKGYKRSGLILSILTSLGCLFFYKYANFTYDNLIAVFRLLGVERKLSPIPQIILPLGISFYVFQTMSYAVDVYRGHIRASRNFINFATYVSMFPQLTAGPIVRYADIVTQLEQKRKPDAVMISEGIERFIIGLAKKMFIANTFASIADAAFGIETEYMSSGVAWIGILAYSFQIYYDFSAYSDMAIGLGKVFGFKFLENFNYPYISTSIKEFWRRWHISLSSWFRDYVYIPLGGNRLGTFRTYVNLFIVFFVTGLWHGASWNFVVWGLWHGVFIVVERIGFERVLERLWRPVRHVYTLLVVVIGWVFFRAESLGDALIYLKKMFVWSDARPEIVFYPSAYVNREMVITAFLAVLFSMPLFPLIRKKMDAFFISNKLSMGLYYTFISCVLIVVMMYLSVDTYNPFIYFRF